MVALLGLALVLQARSMVPSSAGPVAVTAVRATQPPVLDGRDNDEVWRGATIISEFQQVRPLEAGPARFRTEAKVAYDPANLYVFVRAFDPHPDSIIQLLSRRDDQTPSDQVIVMIDSYHDRRNGYEFVVNPAGVKADYAIYNDGNEDNAWDAIWEVATQVDSLGWTAEYKIPFSQLRFATGDRTTFGFAVWRNIQRYTEQVSWPIIRQSKPGFVSQFGELNGLDGLANPHRAEVTPYFVTKNVSQPDGNDFGRQQDITMTHEGN